MKILLSLGSNTPDAQLRIEQAIEAIRLIATDVRTSTIYTTEAVGHPGPDYANCVVEAHTSLSASELQQWAKRTEVLAGRTLDARVRGSVPLDIDVVMTDDTVVRPSEMQAPWFTIGYNQLYTNR